MVELIPDGKKYCLAKDHDGATMLVVKSTLLEKKQDE